MSALVRHRVSLFGKMREPFHSILCFLYCLWLYCINPNILTFLQCSVSQVTTSAVDLVLYVSALCGDVTTRTVSLCAGTDASAIVNCLHILARSLDARFSTFHFLT